MKVERKRKSSIGTTFDLIKTILTICIFFWFGWKVGLIAIILGIDIE